MVTPTTGLVDFPEKGYNVIILVFGSRANNNYCERSLRLAAAAGGHVSHQVQFLFFFLTPSLWIRLVRPTVVYNIHIRFTPPPTSSFNLTVHGYVGRWAGRHFSGQGVHHLARVRRELIARLQVVHQQLTRVHCVVLPICNTKHEHDTITAW